MSHNKKNCAKKGQQPAKNIHFRRPAISFSKWGASILPSCKMFGASLRPGKSSRVKFFIKFHKIRSHNKKLHQKQGQQPAKNIHFCRPTVSSLKWGANILHPPFLQLLPPSVFHDKYKWEIWKNIAGKSATSDYSRFFMKHHFWPPNITFFAERYWQQSW